MISKLLLFVSLFSFQTFASDILDRCELKSNKPDLHHPLNKETICKETLRALFPDVVREEYDYYLRIEANGFQRMYSVELNKIEAFIGNDRVFNVSGVLYWNPDGSDVVID